MRVEVIYIKTNDNSEKVLLVFAKNRIGEYIYGVPVCCKKSDMFFDDRFFIKRGAHKGEHIMLNSCFESNGLCKKIIDGKTDAVSLKTPTNFSNSNCIAIILDEEFEKYIYNKYREHTNKEIGENDFMLLLLAEGDKIGRSIDKIEKKKFGYKAIINDKYKQLDLNDSVALSAFNNPTPVEAKAVASVGEKNTVKKSNSNQQTNIDTIKKIYDKFQYEKPNIGEKEADKTKKSNVEVDKNKEIKHIKPTDIAEIKKEIKKKIINQDKAIDAVLNNIYFNQRYIETGDKDLLRNKANILLEGSTGTGKTFIVEEVASKLKLPIYVTGVTNYSSVGYRGADLVNILSKLLEKASGNLELAERGIIAFDEFDKLGGFADNDISMRKAIQQELLSFISGTTYDVEYNGKTYSFDTSKLTIIAMGAFTNLRERKIEDNEKKNNPAVGFSAKSSDDYEHSYNITKDDFVEEGLERELVGRFSCLTYTNDLSINDLMEILNKSITSPLNGLRITGNLMGCNIVISSEIIYEIASMSFETNTGARGLIEIVQSLKDVIANDLFLGEKEINITKEHLEKTKSVHKRQYLQRKGR